MDFFASTEGQTAMENIASSLARIASALEEHNRLMAKALQTEGGKHLAAKSADIVSAATEELLRIV